MLHTKAIAGLALSCILFSAPYHVIVILTMPFYNPNPYTYVLVTRTPQGEEEIKRMELAEKEGERMAEEAAKKMMEKSTRDEESVFDYGSVATLKSLGSYHSGNTGYTFDSKDTNDTQLVIEASHRLNTDVVTMSYEFN